MLTTYFLGYHWGVCILSHTWTWKSKSTRWKSFFRLNIHLLTQISSKKKVFVKILSLLPVLIFDVNDLLTLSFINSKICEPCLFSFFLFSVFKKCFKNYEKIISSETKVTACRWFEARASTFHHSKIPQRLGALVVKYPLANAGDIGDGFYPWAGKIL